MASCSPAPVAAGTSGIAVSDERSPFDELARGSHDRRSNADATSAKFDRVTPPDPMRPRRSDLQGKRALYSVDPEANPIPLLIVRCDRCEVERGLTASHLPRLLRPPWLLNPCGRTLWTRCPACQRRTWLHVRLGPGIPWPVRPPPS